MYRDRDRQVILAMEPDILVHDVDAIQKEDSLVLTTRRCLKEDQTQMRQIGWTKTHEVSVQHQYIMQLHSTGSTDHHEEEEEESELAPYPIPQRPIFPARMPVRNDRGPLTETPEIEQFHEQTAGLADKLPLLTRVNALAHQRGFRVYKHCDAPSLNGKEHKLILLCG